MKKALFIISDVPFRFHSYKIDTYNYLKNKWVDIYIFERGLESGYDKEWVKLLGFFSKKDIIDNIKNIVNKENINYYYIHTYDEHSINLTNKLKKDLWLPYTIHYEAFENKKLQRKLLLEYNKDITVNFFECSLNNFDYSIADKLDYPFVIKPSRWTQSYGVNIIKNKSDFENYINSYKNIFKKIEWKWYENKVFLFEEFIDWTAWSVDYFVDETQNIYFTKPVFLEFWIDLWIDDFCNVSRVISSETENMLDLKNMQIFVEENVKALWIKNTFVHHEFKFTSKWKYKTIELNWRTGWFRPDMYKKAYWIELFDMVFKKKDFIDKKIINNVAVFALHAAKEWKLIWLNENIVGQIKKLVSLEQIRFLEKYIWTKVWLTRKWYNRVGSIKLKNKNYVSFQNDYDFIRKIYNNLLLVE